MSKREWGNAVWYLIHTLSHKLKEGQDDHIPELYSNLAQIATTLPCPDCSQHASSYIRHYRNKPPTTRDELNMFFWGMHNWVNRRLHKPQFTSKDYIDKYNLAVTHKIIKHYINVMSQNARYDKAMMNTFNRSNMVKKFIKYINNNIYRFN